MRARFENGTLCAVGHSMIIYEGPSKQPASVYILPHGARGKRAAALAVLQ